MPGELNSPYRRDPFTEDFYPRWNGADEIHEAKLQESNGRVGFFLFESPQLRVPSDFVCALLADEYDPTGAELTENARLDAPDADEYRVDYDADGFFGTGFVEVHASLVNRLFRVGYWGLGTPPRWDTHLLAALHVSEDFSVAGDLEVGGDLVVKDEYDDEVFTVRGGVVDAHGNRIRNVANAVDAQDAVPLAQFPSLLPARGTIFLTGSGSWVCPANVTTVIAVLIGAGGDGSTDVSDVGASGGGGASVTLIKTVVPNTSYAYSVAANSSTDTEMFGATAGSGEEASGTSGGAGGVGVLGSGNEGTTCDGGAGLDKPGAVQPTGGGGAGGGFGNRPIPQGGDVIVAGGVNNGGRGGGFFGGDGGAGSTTGPSPQAGGGGKNYGGGGGSGWKGGLGGTGAPGTIILLY